MLSVKNFEMLDYNIRISGNKNGKHDYFFNVDEKFFERFVGHDITKAQIEIIVTLWNNNDKLKLSLNIKIVLKVTFYCFLTRQLQLIIY